uniref:UMOD/GP2/OIT3-like D8C domain-containing protein n=1 Tax=Amphiprion ocellaris TaxID=80972 RepID=A0A3Q1CXL3_AMPOC
GRLSPAVLHVMMKPPAWSQEKEATLSPTRPCLVSVKKTIHCDGNIRWQGWYRMFLGQSSARIPDWCVSQFSCGTHAPIWMTQPHPTEYGRILSRTVCSSWLNGCCYFSSPTIQVKLCYGNYYVYKLQQPPGCALAYCAGNFFKSIIIL